MSKIYYKVTDKACELFKRANEFLLYEEVLRTNQKKAVEAHVPSYKTYVGQRGFNRIIEYVGFCFDDQDNIDAKTWTTKNKDGKMVSYPNRRTKAGKEMGKFLKEFKRTTCWDVDKLLSIDRQNIYGSFYPANLFRYRDCIYILIDEQHHKIFEENNPDAIEITYGEMEKAIDGYNANLN